VNPQMCTQINNFNGLEQVFDQLFEEMESKVTDPSSKKLLRDSLYGPTKTRLNDHRNTLMKHATSLMRPDIQLCLKWASHKNSVNKAAPLCCYLDIPLCTCKARLENNLFLLFLENIFVTILDETDKYIETLVPTDLLGISNVFSQVSSQNITRDLLELLDELCVWINASGDGLPTNITEKLSRVIREKLKFWCSVPSRNIITMYPTWDESNGITKRDLLNVLQARKNDDSEAKEFLSKLGGNTLASVFGKKEEQKDTQDASGDFLNSFFSKKEPVPEPEKPPEGEATIFSAIYDWFQS